LLQKEKERRARGSRGKVAEKKVREYLEVLGARYASFDFERKYDARSAGGRFPSQAGDFGFYKMVGNGAVSGLIEVKEIAHDYRLPNKNFSSDRIARLKKRFLAGQDIIILVYHTEAKLWRCPPFDIFMKDPTAASWDLSVYERFSLVQEAVDAFEALQF
jgi:hypothetical protein